MLDRYERWKAIDLIERRNKREIVSPKFLPKMGENLKERYLEGGRGQLPITLMPCSPSKVSCNLAIRSIVDNVFVKKKKKKRGRQTRSNEKSTACPQRYTQTCIPCQLMTVRRSSSSLFPPLLSISFPIGQKLANRHLLRRIQSRRQGGGVVLLSTRGK